MQLFILGPAFGLPSIDAECIAAITFLKQQEVPDWELISCHDQAPSTLPLLVDGKHRLSRYHNIVRHLDSSQQDAKSIALASFLETNARPLIDSSLYVSADNYSSVTRPAFTKFLPIYANYVLPPAIRNAARTRVEPLGITSGDVDDVHDDMSGRPEHMQPGGAFEAETRKRASLLLNKRDTLKSLLRRPENNSIFKLHALVANFCEPLEDLLDKQEYLAGDKPSRVDYLAYGYLGLMLLPEVPQDWLRNAIRKKHARVASYFDRMHEGFGVQTDVRDAISTVDRNQGWTRVRLPWSKPATASVGSALILIANGILSGFPRIRHSIFPTRMIYANGKPQNSWTQLIERAFFPVSILSAVALYSSLRLGYLIWPHGERIQVFRAFRSTPSHTGFNDALSVITGNTYQAWNAR